jgi:thioredoxin-dependent peroxiredoxin
VVAISTDDLETMKKWKAELKAPYSFIADPDAKIVALYDVKIPVVGLANRYTFVVGQDGKVSDVKSGSDAIDPGGSIDACPLHRPPAAK